MSLPDNLPDEEAQAFADTISGDDVVKDWGAPTVLHEDIEGADAVYNDLQRLLNAPLGDVPQDVKNMLAVASIGMVQVRTLLRRAEVVLREVTDADH